MRRVFRGGYRLTQAAHELRAAPTRCEAILWQELRRDRLGVRFRRQHPMLGFVADFYAPAAALVVEVDGDVHCTAEARARDADRDARMGAAGLRVIRVTNRDVEMSLATVVARIRAAISAATSKGPLLENFEEGES